MRQQWWLVVVLCCGVLAGSALSWAGQAGDRWKDLRLLLGEWEGVGRGSPGEGTGTFTFELALDGNILIRRGHSSHPATRDRPAVTHISGDARRRQLVPVRREPPPDDGQYERRRLLPA